MATWRSGPPGDGVIESIEGVEDPGEAEMGEAIRAVDGGSAGEHDREWRAGPPPPWPEPPEWELPSARWRRQVLAAPGLALLGVAMLVAEVMLDNRQGRRAAALCHRLPVPWTQFAAAYAALLCGVAGSVLCVLLFRAASRVGARGAETWQGTLALCICVANVLALLVEAVAVHGVHAEAGDPYWQCSGAPALAGLHMLMQSHVL